MSHLIAFFAALGSALVALVWAIPHILYRAWLIAASCAAVWVVYDSGLLGRLSAVVRSWL